MFVGREQFTELKATLRTNKLRTALTGFSVGWGILLLIILLSSGAGFRNAVFKSSTTVGLNNSAVNLYFSGTSIPYNGLPSGFYPRYSLRDCERIAEQIPEIKLYAPVVRNWFNVEAENRSASVGVLGTFPVYNKIQEHRFFTAEGRFLNDLDIKEARKVIVLSDETAQNLFGKPENAFGKSVKLAGISLKVIGVCKKTTRYNSICYIPYTTMKTLFSSRAVSVSQMLVLGPRIVDEVSEDAFKAKFVKVCAGIKGFSPEDKRVVWVNSTAQSLKMMDQIFGGIDLLLWIIGLSTLTIGLVGVINIMQITVTERRREIGIRKALGAKSKDIISSVLLESVVVTLISGLAGLSIGVGIMALVNKMIETTGLGTKVVDGNAIYIFYKPIINFETTLTALLIMILGGLIAGYLPARKAVRVPTVEAMRK